MNNHLTEEQFQDYLEDNDQLTSGDFEEHLRICGSCQKNLEIYQRLYTALDVDPFPPLSKDFSSRVVSAISDPQESRWQFFESSIIVAIFLFGIAASLYFINPLPFLSQVANNILNNLGEYATKLIPEFNGSLPIFIVAIVIFLLVEILDKKILRSRS